MKIGMHKDIPLAEYLADPALSSGTCHTLNTRSPYHAWHESSLNPNRVQDNSKIADRGTTAHAILLEGSEAGIEVIDPRDFAGKKGGIPKGWTNDAIRTMRDSCYACGKTPILLEDMGEIRDMVGVAKSFIAHSEIAHVFEHGDSELTLCWDEDGTLLKARPDRISADRKLCISYKTTAGSAHPESWIRTQLVPMGYDVSAVFYERGILACFPDIEEATVIHLVQEQSEPYACSLVGLSPGMAQIANGKVERAIAQWAKCLAAGKWPAYSDKIHFAEPTAWQLSAEEEQDMLSKEELAFGVPA